MKWKRSVKRALSLVLALFLMLPGNVPGMVVNAEGVGDWITSSDAVTVTGDAQNGYGLSTTEAGQSALLKMPVDFTKQSIEFTFNPEDGKWAYLYLKGANLGLGETAPAFGGGWLNDNGGEITIQMERKGNDLKFALIAGWYPGNVFGIIQNFAWEQPHKLGITQLPGDENCYLKIDDVVFQETEVADAGKHMSTNGKYFRDNGGAYVTVGVHDSTVMPGTIKVVANEAEPDPGPEPEVTDWITSSDAVTVTGDAQSGYGLSTTEAGQSALLKTPVDFTNQSIEFTFNPEDGKWAYLYLKGANLGLGETAPAFDGGWVNDNGGEITIQMERKGNDLKFALIAGWYPGNVFGTIQNFAWEQPHKLGITQLPGDENCYLKIDDVVFQETEVTDAGKHMSTNGKYFRDNGGAYVTVGVHDSTVMPGTIKVVTNETEPDPGPGPDPGPEPPVDPDPVIPEYEDWVVNSDGITIRENPEGGYELSTTKMPSAALLKRTIDFEKQDIHFTFRPTQDGEWTYLYLQAADAQLTPTVSNFGGGWLNANGQITIQLKRMGNNLQISMLANWNEYQFGTIENFDWDAEHTIGIVDCSSQGDGNCYLKVDNTLFRDTVSPDARVWMSTNGFYFKNHGGAYAVFGVHDSLVLPDTVKVADRSNDPSEPELPPVEPDPTIPQYKDWIVGSSAVKIADRTDGGYDLSVSSFPACALLKTPVDFDSQRIEFAIEPEDGQWAYLYLRGLGENQIVSNFDGGWLSDQGRITIQLKRAGEDLQLAMLVNWTEYPFGVIRNFDWSKVHTIGIADLSEEGDENCYLQVDDTIFSTTTTTDAKLWMSANGRYYREHGGAYVTVGVHDSLAMPKTIRVVEKTSGPLEGDWDVSSRSMVTITGDADAGYRIEVDESQDGSASVLFRNPIDLGGQAMEFSLGLEDTEWNYMHLKSAALGIPKAFTDHIQVESWGGQHDGGSQMTLRFDRDGNDLKVAYWFGWAPEGEGIYEVLGTLKNFDWKEKHIMSFIQDPETYSWTLKIDDTLLDGQNGTEIASWMNANLNHYQQNGGVYLRIGARGNNQQKKLFETIRFIKNNENQTEKPDFNPDWVSNGMVVTGDAKNGYRLVGPADLASAYFRQPMKPEQTELTFRYSVSEDTWGYISLSEDPQMSILAGDEELKEKNGMIIILERKDTTMNLQIYTDNKVVPLMSYENFDFNANHTISFVREWGSWYLVFDGQILRSHRLNEYFFEQLVAVKEGLYYRFSARLAPFSFENVSFRQTAGSDMGGEYDWEITGYYPGEGSVENPTFRGTGIAAYKPLVDLSNTTIRARIQPEVNGWQCMQLSDVMTSDEKVLPRLTTPEDGSLTMIFGREESGALRFSLYSTLADGTKAEKLIGMIEGFDWNAVHEFRFVNRNGNWYVVLDTQSFEFLRYGEDTYVTDQLSRILNGRNGQVYVRFSDCWFKSDNTWGDMGFVEEAYRRPAVDHWPTMHVASTGDGWTFSGEGNAGFTQAFDFKKDCLKFRAKPEIDSWVGINFGIVEGSALGILQGVDNPYDILNLIFARDSDKTLRLSVYDGTKEIALGYLADFDFDAEHILSFVNRKGNWYLSIDGRTFEGLNRDSEGIAAGWIRRVTRNLGGRAYVRMGTPGFTSLTMKGVGIVDKRDLAFQIPELLEGIDDTPVPESLPVSASQQIPVGEEPMLSEPTRNGMVPMKVVLAGLSTLAVLAVGAVAVLLAVGRRKGKKGLLSGNCERSNSDEE